MLLLHSMLYKKTPEQMLQEYKIKSQEILKKMTQVMIRAQRKIDDEAYRKVLEKQTKI
jgi:hypothetical protein